MIVIRFLESLEQLTITIVGLPEKIEQSKIKLSQNGDLAIEKFGIKLIPENTFQLDIDSLRFNQSNYNDQWYISLILGAKLCKPIESPKLEEWSPPVDDLLNDWVFCHQHGDGQMMIGEGKPKESPSLETINQIKFLIRKQPMMSTVLFESNNKNDNLAVRVINPKVYIGLKNDLVESQVNEIKLTETAAIQYKVLSNQDNLTELKEFRHSFKVDWYILNDPLFNDFLTTIEHNNLNKFFLAQISDEDGFLDAFI